MILRGRDWGEVFVPFMLVALFLIGGLVGLSAGWNLGRDYTICENCPGFNASVDDWLDRPGTDCYAPIECMVCVDSGSPVPENLTSVRGGR